jgi:hypothetical protein
MTQSLAANGVRGLLLAPLGTWDRPPCGSAEPFGLLLELISSRRRPR